MRTALHLVSAVALAGFLGGCETIEQNVGTLLGGDSSSVDEAETSERAFAIADGIAVHAEASAASPVVGRLRLHEPVTRGETRDGFAQIAASGSNLSGWVDGSELIAALPASPSSHTATRHAPPPHAAPPAPPPADSGSDTPQHDPAAADAPSKSPPPAAEPSATPVSEPDAPVKVASDDVPADAPAAAPPTAEPPAVKAKPAGEMLNPF